MEIWKDIEGYEGHYQVSNMGAIKSVQRVTHYLFPGGKACQRVTPERLKSAPVFGNGGYRQIMLYKHNVGKMYQVHRLVAAAFIPNPDSLPTVNHKNGIKTDNRADNLEWCSYSDNNLHALNVLGRKPGYCKKVMCIETQKIYDSVAAASRQTGESEHSLRGHLRGRTQSLHNKHWQFVKNSQ